MASTTHGKSSRKTSAANDEMEGEEENEEEIDEENEALGVDDGIDEEFKEGGQQKFLTAQDVKEHIEALWRKEKDLLDLVYGKFAPSIDDFHG